MSIELEARLLAAIRTPTDFERLAQLSITEADFPNSKPLYHYIRQMIEQYGKVPRLVDLRDTFNLPASVKRDPTEFNYLLEEYRRTVVAKNLQEIIDKTAQEHGEDPDALLDALITRSSALQRGAATHMSVTDGSMPDRLAGYATVADTYGKIRGVPTGMMYFDDMIGLGWLPGELVGIVGRLYVGKSWMLMYFGIIAWQAGERVLLLSPEMPLEEAEARFDALILAKHDMGLDTTQLYRGFKPSEKVQAVGKQIAASGRWFTYDSTAEGGFGLSSIAALTQRHRASVVLIDGLPLLESAASGRRQVWETIKDLSYGLKRIAVQLGAVVIITHQATRSAHNSARPPALHEISFGDAFAQACDRVLALSRPVTPPDVLRITVQKFRKGRPHTSGIDFKFDPQKGDIHELVSGHTDRPGVEREDLPEWEGTGTEVPLP